MLPSIWTRLPANSRVTSTRAIAVSLRETSGTTNVYPLKHVRCAAHRVILARNSSAVISTIASHTFGMEFPCFCYDWFNVFPLSACHRATADAFVFRFNVSHRVFSLLLFLFWGFSRWIFILFLQASLLPGLCILFLERSPRQEVPPFCLSSFSPARWQAVTLSLIHI